MVSATVALEPLSPVRVLSVLASERASVGSPSTYETRSCPARFIAIKHAPRAASCQVHHDSLLCRLFRRVCLRRIASDLGRRDAVALECAPCDPVSGHSNPERFYFARGAVV